MTEEIFKSNTEIRSTPSIAIETQNVNEITTNKEHVFQSDLLPSDIDTKISELQSLDVVANDSGYETHSTTISKLAIIVFL